LLNALYVSDGLSVHHQEFKTVYTSTVYVKQLLLPAAVCAVLSSWWWTKRPSETCRVFYKNKRFEI